MEVDDFKHLWFRDKAWLLKKPSIDRIDSKGNYELNNCRFIELSINAAAGGRQKKPRRVARLGLKCTKAHKEKISRAKKGIPWTEARRLAQENRKSL